MLGEENWVFCGLIMEVAELLVIYFANYYLTFRWVGDNRNNVTKCIDQSLYNRGLVPPPLIDLFEGIVDVSFKTGLSNQNPTLFEFFRCNRPPIANRKRLYN